MKLILKSPGFVPFGANLTHFRFKSDIPVFWSVAQSSNIKPKPGGGDRERRQGELHTFQISLVQVSDIPLSLIISCFAILNFK